VRGLKLPNQKVLICGVREIIRAGKPTLLFLDWYLDGAKTSFINEEVLNAWKNQINKIITTTVDIGEYQGKAQYRIDLPLV
jgi:hypothetical protein